MVIKYTVVKQRSYDSGKLFIAPDMIFDDEKLAHDRAVFGSEAYGEAHIVIELRPIERVKSK